MTLAEVIDLYEDLDLANATAMAARGQIHCDYCCETPHSFILTGGEAKALCDYHHDLYKLDWWEENPMTTCADILSGNPRFLTLIPCAACRKACKYLLVVDNIGSLCEECFRLHKQGWLDLVLLVKESTDAHSR